MTPGVGLLSSQVRSRYTQLHQVKGNEKASQTSVVPHLPKWLFRNHSFISDV